MSFCGKNCLIFKPFGAIFAAYVLLQNRSQPRLSFGSSLPLNFTPLSICLRTEKNKSWLWISSYGLWSEMMELFFSYRRKNARFLGRNSAKHISGSSTRCCFWSIMSFHCTLSQRFRIPKYCSWTCSFNVFSVSYLEQTILHSSKIIWGHQRMACKPFRKPIIYNCFQLQFSIVRSWLKYARIGICLII